MLPADYWIKKLQLTAHPEGGAYTQTYRSGLVIPATQLPGTFRGARPISTAIYFLLQKEQFSALHRIASDELWHFYYGDPLLVFEIDPTGHLSEHLLGNDPEKNESFQCIIKAGSWFGAALQPGGQYALTGCTVSPGFDFADFELGTREALLQLYPRHADQINRLTR